MESPPSFTPPGKKSNTGLIVGLIVGGVVLCCVLPIGLIAGGGFFAFKKVQGSITCAFAFEQIRTSVTDYADANGGKLPTASKWMDQVRPYYEKQVKSAKVEKNPFGTLPVNGVWGCTDDTGLKTGIAFNSELSNKKLADIKDKASTILIFEVPSAEMNRNEPYKPQPKNTSPKVFGNPRGWIYAPVEGKLDGSDIADATEGSQSGVNVKVKTD